MRFTLSSSVLPWLSLAADSGKCSIIPEGVDPSGGGGGAPPAAAAPAAAAPPTPASQVPDPSSLRVISRPGSTPPPPAQQAPPPAAPQGAPQGGGVPAQQQQQQGQQPSPYITRDELKTLLAESLSQHFQQLGQTVNQGSGQSAAPQAPAGQNAAGQSNTASGAAQPQQGQQSQLLVAQANPEFLALQTKVREQEQALAEIQKAKAEAEYKADVASATNAAQRALTDHPTYRMQPVAAAQAVEVMLLKGRIGIHPQPDGSKQTWVMLPNAQTGKTDVFPLHEGVVKWLEGSEGAFYRPQVKPGMGAMASTPGHAPISVPAQTHVPQGSKTPGSLQEAFEKQQALSQGHGTGY